MKPQARKSLGQHFLADPNYCRKIVQFAEIRPEDTVVEIGPGTGQLTKVLMNIAQKVIAVEFDSTMIEYLKDHWQDHSSHQKGQLQLIQANILTLDWETIPGRSVKVVGNLPYNISTRILKRMTEIKNRFQSCTVMVQKEVAQRISAAPPSKDYGYFTLLIEYHFQRVEGFDVPPGVFVPRPKVMSHVMKLIPHIPPCPVPNYEAFLALLKEAFQQRRKTLWNNLKGNHEPERVRAAFDACDIEVRARPEAVSLKQYACLARML